MREIKFRAWDLVTKTMKEVRGIFYFRGDELKMVNITENRRFEFMQFTGLKDSKGKEIYEGDIVIADDGGEWFPHEYDEEKDEYYPTGKYLVEYDSEFARFILIDPKTNCEAECDYNPFSLPDFTLEVIGNKFQNPELLKEVKNEIL